MGDCGLRTPIEIADCGLRIPILNRNQIANLNRQSPISIVNRQSQSSIANLNPQSELEKSPIATRQSTIDQAVFTIGMRCATGGSAGKSVNGVDLYQYAADKKLSPPSFARRSSV